jgi:hypothetical protein
MTAYALAVAGAVLVLGAMLFGSGGSNGAAEHPAAGPGVPLGSVTRPTATPYTAVSSIEDGRDNRRGKQGPSELPPGVIRAYALPALPSSIEDTASIEDGRALQECPWGPGGGCFAAPPHPAPALPLSIEALICAMPWPCGAALAVAWCESRYDPAATNGAHIGVFQLSSRWHGWRLGAGESFVDAATNIDVAFQLWSEQGWTPWPNCRP